MRRGLAEQLGALDTKGRGFGLSTAWIGMDVTGYIETDIEKEICVGREECKGQGACRRSESERKCRKNRIFKSGHKFFNDCTREMNARKIEWMMNQKNVDSWFVTLTFKNFISENRARQLVKSWLYSLTDGYGQTVKDDEDYRGHGLKWVVAQEWQKRHVIHFHIAISGVRLGSLSRIRWEGRWTAMRYEIAGTVYRPCGFARIYDACREMAPYLAKYVGKTDDSGDALEWGGSWQGITAPDSLRCCKA
jgi:hypothetical protein